MRQLRCYFALHEMDERRALARREAAGRREQGRAGTTGGHERPHRLEIIELRRLIGGEAPDHELATDVRTLHRIGLIELEGGTLPTVSVRFATSIEQLCLPTGPAERDSGGGDYPVRPLALRDFWEMLHAIPKVNQRRALPFPAARFEHWRVASGGGPPPSCSPS